MKNIDKAKKEQSMNLHYEKDKKFDRSSKRFSETDSK